MKKEKPKNFVYIVQSSTNVASCKIGITDNLQRRLKDYNNITGVSKDTFKYLFTCKVKNGWQVENDIKKNLVILERIKAERCIFVIQTCLKIM